MPTESNANRMAEIEGKEMLSNSKVLLPTWESAGTLNSYDLIAAYAEQKVPLVALRR